MSLEHEELTGQIIGAAIEVHKTLGPGYLETVYENALALELRARSIPFQRQLTVPVSYRGSEVGLHRLDLLVANLVVVESKRSRRWTMSTSPSFALTYGPWDKSMDSS